MRDAVLRYVREGALLRAGDRVLIAVSGGADSVALLRILLNLRSELGIVLAVAHLNHGLRGAASEADEHFVAELARQHKLEFFSESLNVAEYASANRLSLEAAGRKLRYDFFRRIAEQHAFNAVATGHTQDDQAETVLLKFLRGAGTKGLAGVHPLLTSAESLRIRFVRPLLATSRAEVEAYLAAVGQTWREDESNLDPHFHRNRIRHELLPLLAREYNPNILQLLSDTAEVARGEEKYWNAVVHSELKRWRVAPRRLQLQVLSPFSASFSERPLALQRRLLKRFLEDEGIASGFRYIEHLRHCAADGSGRVELPGGWIASIQNGRLVLHQPSQHKPAKSDYEYRFTIPGEVFIPELEAILRVVFVSAEFAIEAHPGTLLRAQLLGPQLSVRNWRPGDRYQPACSGSEQKLKRFFSEQHVPSEKRPSWPVVLNGTEIIWVRDFPVAENYKWRPGDGDGLKIEIKSSV